MVTFPIDLFLVDSDLEPVRLRKQEFYYGLTRWKAGVSETGLRLESEVRLSRDQVYTLHFSLPGRPRRLSEKVRIKAALDEVQLHFGAAFDAPSYEAQQALKAFVAEFATDAAGGER